MFTSSRPFLVYDYFRVPYSVDPVHVESMAPPAPMKHWGRIVPSGTANAPALSWPLFRDGEPAPAGALGPRRLSLNGVVGFGRVVPDEVLGPVLDAAPDDWSAVEVVHDDRGPCGSVWRSSSGCIVLPFDPDEVVTGQLSERYADLPGTARTLVTTTLRSTYYSVRPMLPRRLQIALRRAYSRVQRRATFPRWPVEPSLHDFYDLVLRWSSELADSPVPWISPWPEGRTWALVLTHDVETAAGVELLPVLRDVEQRLGYRSSWNFVPGRYQVEEELVQDLWRTGFEVGLHGLRHDGRDLDPQELPRRLPQMRRYAEDWGAVGFRSPATQRAWSTMSGLPFEYDSSYPDTDPFEPQAGGCCSWLPFLIGDLVELPITLAQDHTLFVILGVQDGRVWCDKVEHIRSRGGLALVLTHPDYLSGSPLAAAYEELLTRYLDDPQVWRALPAAVADWWRRRAASSLVREGTGWRVVGPAAAEAGVSLTHVTPRQHKEARR
jgi:peptidoglycan/xylan/chitin deacetylase (PgdA/CDA1 family)